MKGGVFARTEEDEFGSKEKPYESQICGAKTRSGNPCKKWGMKPSGRCRLHGGKSTGPKTEEGKARISAARLKDGHYTKEAIEQRRLKYKIEQEACDWWYFQTFFFDVVDRGHLAAEYYRLWKRICGQEIYLRHFKESPYLRRRFFMLLCHDKLRSDEFMSYD
jgi:hypothetical protein